LSDAHISRSEAGNDFFQDKSGEEGYQIIVAAGGEYHKHVEEVRFSSCFKASKRDDNDFTERWSRNKYSAD
jgi:hypothetical protein